MKNTKTPDLPLSIRAIIVAFRVFFHLGWTKISKKLGTDPTTVQKFFQCMQRLANGSEDFWYLLSHIEPSGCHHPAPLIAPGSEESLEVRKAVLKHKTWMRNNAVNYERSKANLPPLKCTTVQNICLDFKHAAANPKYPKRIKRKRQPCKTALDEEDRSNWLQYTQDLEEAEAESDILTNELANKLKDQIQKLKDTVSQQQKNAESPGTLEWELLQQKNMEICAYNDAHFTPA
ncbi:hypothetical protein EJ02DRAFT_471610 [Clathrospora elynae]|uniref:Uncharacterized protein n=1 Tax=Clathrospora elynae TaxID=706981 RepID=A0A6A5S5G3_9PLEO|nr:hypothetical protein EJ02DRAFT_471610 [Clathrospora elynae]